MKELDKENINPQNEFSALLTKEKNYNTSKRYVGIWVNIK